MVVVKVFDYNVILIALSSLAVSRAVPDVSNGLVRHDLFDLSEHGGYCERINHLPREVRRIFSASKRCLIGAKGSKELHCRRPSSAPEVLCSHGRKSLLNAVFREMGEPERRPMRPFVLKRRWTRTATHPKLDSYTRCGCMQVGIFNIVDRGIVAPVSLNILLV